MFYLITAILFLICISILTCNYFLVKSENYNKNLKEGLCWAGYAGLGILFIVFFMNILFSTFSFTRDRAELTRLDKEKQITIESNNQSVNRVIPVLQKYPQIEKDLLLSLKPEQVLVLSQTYPELKSDKFIEAEAEIISDNIYYEKRIQLKKIEIEKNIEIRKFWVLF